MRAALLSFLPLLRAIGITFMAWKLLGLACDTAHPAMVVVSGSMEPTFQRGDVIFLSNRQRLVEVGDIPVMWFEGQPLPMVHRAVEVLQG
jgi:signal peptidase